MQNFGMHYHTGFIKHLKSVLILIRKKRENTGKFELALTILNGLFMNEIFYKKINN